MLSSAQLRLIQRLAVKAAAASHSRTVRVASQLDKLRASKLLQAAPGNVQLPQRYGRKLPPPKVLGRFDPSEKTPTYKATAQALVAIYPSLPEKAN